MRNQKKAITHKKRFFAIFFLSITVCMITAGCRSKEIMEDDHTKEGVFQAAEGTTYEDWESKTESADSSYSIYVHVCGEVKKPGLYTFEAGQRVNDAVEAAGGFTDHANKEAVNLASILEDGQQIRIPDKAESSERIDTASGLSSGKSGTGSGKVNINSASADELASLSGIGDSKAAAILTYREEHGSFSKEEDIKKVPGIGEGTYKKIKDSISV